VIEKSQEIITSIIGSENFDIGHTFATITDGEFVNGSYVAGRASVGKLCINKDKARAWSGYRSSYSSFERTIVHEMGHQFGAQHTFSACDDIETTRNVTIEPGSGSTIMSYFGACEADNVSGFRENFFHLASINQMLSIINACSHVIANPNRAPTIEPLPSQYTIPILTPFKLEVNAFDIDGDELTYTFEQMDTEPASSPPKS